MRLPHNSNNLAYVRSLRKNMTDAERKLWYEYLRPCPYKFTRQKSVGPYILDFYCASAQLAVEIDGSQHYEPQGQQQDAARTAYLQAFGIFVLRFSNRDVLLNMLDKTSSIICAFGLASAAPRSPYRHLELCGIAL